MVIAACIVYVLIVAAVVAWLLYELRADKRDHIEPTVPGPRERLPPRVDL
jgi:hypothetical protein